MTDNLLPGDDLHSRARYLLSVMEQWQRDQLKAQADQYGVPLLDLCADFISRCEAGEQ